MKTDKDTRFSVPLYTVVEAAQFLGVPQSTFSTWSHGYVRRPSGRAEVRGEAIVTSVDAPRGFPAIPFIGLAEGMVLAAFRRTGVSLQHIRKAVAVLDREIGIDYALASSKLYTDGAVILYDYAERKDQELAELTEVVSQQRVFSPVVAEVSETSSLRRRRLGYHSRIASDDATRGGNRPDSRIWTADLHTWRQPR